MGIEFRLLGDVEVRVGDRVVEAGHARQRCVLVALLVDANRLVPVDQLLDRVWAGRPPQRVRNALSGYVSRLRQAVTVTGEAAIARRSDGYLMTVDPMVVDLHLFHHLTAQARGAHDPDDALALFEQALRLWREPAFGTLDTPWLNDLRAGLEAQRLAAELDRNELALAHGRHAALVEELSARAAVYPLDERLAGQLILALYRCGRQAEALRQFERLRRGLADELGVDPWPPLRQLHQQILTADTALGAVEAAPAHTVPWSVRSSVPRQLPAPPGSFTGRARELAALRTFTDATGEQPDIPVVVALSGTAGVGKTEPGS